MTAERLLTESCRFGVPGAALGEAAGGLGDAAGDAAGDEVVEEFLSVAAALDAAEADDEEGGESVAVELSLVIDVVDSVRLAA